MIKLKAKQRLQATPWDYVYAMPQIIPEELPSHWFDNFDQLVPDQELFEYGGHRIMGYHARGDDTKFFVALNESGKPVYINEVSAIAVTSEITKTQQVLDGYKFWTQGSVAFSKDADRARLKGLATKIFWDYLATGKNVAITDSQQTPAGATFWKKILTSAKYMALVVDDTYTSKRIHVVGGSDRWTDATHLKYDMSLSWKESREGTYLRVAVRR